ncbi:MAG: alpha-amylase family protein [Kiritimatiellia bacterium]
MQPLRFRQIHLDFHTSEHIPGIGTAFEKGPYQETLKQARVNSVTTFATCHHGWSYYRSKVGPMHPNLSFDLLRAQFDACKEIGINVPIYLTAGVNNMAATAHPEWRQTGPDGRLTGWAKSNIDPGFFMMCFNTGYLDFLCEQIREVVGLFPDNDGIFLDIISQPQCVCHRCLDSMRELGLNPLCEEDRQQHSRVVLEKYYRATTEAATHLNPDNAIFHNSGHITQGDTDILKYFSHLELESLPTGGWGYDHFPMSAKYCANLPHDVMGMTGKFHTTWGEFGGIKHPNALRYECAQMLAVGSKCSVGDQLHPQGVLDLSTYNVIGEAYREVEAKEPWCVNAKPVSDIGLLSSVAVNHSRGRESAADVGAGRILLEGHFLFDVLDADMDVSGRKALLLPDDVVVDETLKTRIDTFLAAGGKLILSGTSGLKADGSGFLWDIGAAYEGESEFQPDYILPSGAARPDFVQSPLVMYTKSQRIRVTGGRSLGAVLDPYFNRRYDHFCSHQHAPNRPEPSGYDCGVVNGSILYVAHSVFTQYRGYGAVAYRQYITRVLRDFLEGDLGVTSTLPSTARLHLNAQPEQNRLVLHLLFAQTVLRGGTMEMHGGTVRNTQPIEVVEELLPLRDTQIRVRVPQPVSRITLEPQGKELSFRQTDDGVEFTVESFTCHQMVSISL